ncbi:MAG: hypothetical protein GX931_02360 [Acholeplasmataceae bacterium]|nr:hypothetical protein [Acholeplasmataceae bacterium]
MDKKQFIRDALLVGIVVTVVVVIYIISIINRKPGEVATINYDNKPLFSVSLNDGKLNYNTKVYEVNAMPKIEEGKLYVNNVLFEKLEKGSGVLVYENYYVILGNVDYVMIEYNSKNKTIKVLEETSPYNICSTQGESKGAPIVCLPNLVTITFDGLKNVDEII